MRRRHPRGRRITLKTWSGRPGLLLVTDTGAGMPEEVRRRRARALLHHEGSKATGWGSAWPTAPCSATADLTLESTEGQGTAGDQPATASKRAVAKTSAKMDKTPAALRILVIDDELQVRSTLAEMLEEQGHSVTQGPRPRGLYSSSRIGAGGRGDQHSACRHDGLGRAAGIHERWPGLPWASSPGGARRKSRSRSAAA